MFSRVTRTLSMIRSGPRGARTFARVLRALSKIRCLAVAVTSHDGQPPAHLPHPRFTSLCSRFCCLCAFLPASESPLFSNPCDRIFLMLFRFFCAFYRIRRPGMCVTIVFCPKEPPFRDKNFSFTGRVVANPATNLTKKREEHPVGVQKKRKIQQY